MKPSSGKLLDQNDNVFDLVEALKKASVGSSDNTYMSPSDFAAAYASPTTLTLTNLPYVPTVAQFVSVKVQPASGAAVTYTPENSVFAYNSATGVLTITGAAFLNTDNYVVTVIGPKKDPMDSASKSSRVSVINGPETNFQGDMLANVTAGNAPAAGTSYFYLPMDMMAGVYFQYSLTKGGATSLTLTVEATLQDDGTAQASCDYIDITNADFGAASFTASAMLATTKGFQAYKYVRLKLVSVGADQSTTAYKLMAKRLFY